MIFAHSQEILDCLLMFVENKTTVHQNSEDKWSVGEPYSESGQYKQSDGPDQTDIEEYWTPAWNR